MKTEIRYFPHTSVDDFLERLTAIVKPGLDYPYSSTVDLVILPVKEKEILSGREIRIEGQLIERYTFDDAPGSRPYPGIAPITLVKLTITADGWNQDRLKIEIEYEDFPYCSQLLQEIPQGVFVGEDEPKTNELTKQLVTKHDNFMKPDLPSDRAVRRQIELLYLIYVEAWNIGDSSYPVSLGGICSANNFWRTAAEDLAYRGLIELRGNLAYDDVIFMKPAGREQVETWRMEFQLDQRLQLDHLYEASLIEVGENIAKRFGGDASNWKGRSRYRIDWNLKLESGSDHMMVTEQQESNSVKRLTLPQLNKLSKLISEWFSMDELRSLSMSLSIDYENLAHDTKDNMARELVLLTNRENKVQNLWEKLHQERGHVPWSDVLK